MMYKTISINNRCDDFISSPREFQLVPSVNTKLDARFNKIELMTNGEIKTVLVFKFDYLPARTLEMLSTYGVGESLIYAPELHQDILSSKSMKIIADVYKNRMQDFIKLVKQKFFDKFEFPLLGSSEVTDEESIRNVELLLPDFIRNNEHP